MQIDPFDRDLAVLIVETSGRPLEDKCVSFVFPVIKRLLVHVAGAGGNKHLGQRLSERFETASGLLRIAPTRRVGLTLPKEHLAYAFLHEVSRVSKSQPLSPPALDYTRYCHAFIRAAEDNARTSNMPPSSAEFHLYRLSLGMRHVFRILYPDFGKKNRFDQRYIARARDRLVLEGRLDEETVTQYIEVVRRAFADKSWGPSYFKRRARRMRRQFDDDEQDAGRRIRLRLKPRAVADWLSNEEVSVEQLIRVREVEGLSRQAVREGEGHEDYEVAKIEVEVPVYVDPRTAAVVAKRREAHLRRSLFHTPHLPNTAQLPEIAGLLHMLFATPIEGMTAGELERALVLLLLLHAGIEEANIRRMRLASVPTVPEQLPAGGCVEKKGIAPDAEMDVGSEREASAPFLDPDRLCLWHELPPEALGRYKGMALDFDTSLARSSGLLVIVPLLGTAKEVSRALIRARRDRNVSDTASLFGSVLVRPKALAGFLGDVSPGPIELSVPRLRNAFEALYIGRSGLNPIHACLISNRIPWHLSSQLFYQHVWLDDLRRAYGSAFIKVERIIQSEEGALGLLPSACPRFGARTVEVDRETSALIAGRGCGSRIVPLDSAIRDAFAGLADLIESKSEPGSDQEHFELHNLLLCYAYRVLLLSTGLRPRRDPVMDEIRFREDDSLFFIEDKNSPTYNEQRVVPLPKPVPALLAHVLASQKRIEALAEFNNKSLWSWQRQSGGDPGLVQKGLPSVDRLRRLTVYFVDADGKARRLTPRAVERTLDPYPDLKARFNLPLNFGRHWLQTRLVEEGVSMDLADYFLGHHRLGKELLSRFSLASFREAIDLYRAKVQGLIDSVGIRDPLVPNRGKTTRRGQRD